MAEFLSRASGLGTAAPFWASRTVEERFLARLYVSARAAVVQAGYANEVEWQATRSVAALTEREFLSEAAWVVLSSGLGVATVRRVYPAVEAAFKGFQSAVVIVQERSKCVRRALRVFAHPGKMNAIACAAEWCDEVGVAGLREILLREGHRGLQHLPYMGPATSRHLAKNLGVAVSKPDRHLERMAAVLPVLSVGDMCTRISELVGDSVEVVDLVLWRACVLGALRPH